MGQRSPTGAASGVAERSVGVGLLLRTLRQARGVSQGGWAAHLGYGRKTVQRWETGETVPDAAAEAAILAWCAEQGLFQPGVRAPLGGVGVSPEQLRAALAAARLGGRAGPSPVPIPLPPAPPAAAPVDPPSPLATLVGREAAVADAARRLGGARLLTLTGPGGVGKTRLALAVAERVRSAYADGVAFVDLAPLQDPALVASAIARALDLPAYAGRPPLETLRGFLRDKRLLLVLDNFEHVLEAAPLARDLLGASPGSRLLVTSRAPLRLSGETEYPVPPLAVPDVGGACEGGLDALARIPAVALFVQRARDVRPDFALTPENAATVAALCRRLDGLPLALELAAARVRILPPAALLARLDERLTLLVDGARDLPERQRTLRATIAWSYTLLTPPDQTLFRSLAAFVGGCTLEAVEAVCRGADAALGDLVRGVAALVEHNLLVAETGPNGAPRFRMLETIRAFAGEELAADHGTAAAVERAHAAYYGALMARAASWNYGGDWDGPATLVMADAGNVRAALDRAYRHADIAAAGRMFAVFPAWWFVHAPEEALRRTEAFLALPAAAAPTRGRADLLLMTGIVLTAGMRPAVVGEPSRAAACLEEAATIYRREGDRHGLGHALLFLGGWAQPPAAGRALVAESAQLLGAVGNLPNEIVALDILAMLALQDDDPEAARALVREAAVRASACPNAFLHALTRLYEGWLALYEGDLMRAREHLEAAALQLVQVGDQFHHGSSLFDLGCIAVLTGDAAAAARWFGDALRLAWDRGPRGIIPPAVEGLGAAAALRGEPARAARLFGAARAAAQEMGVPTRSDSPILRHYRQRLDALRDPLRREAALHACWDEGSALPLATAIRLALAVADPG